MEVVDYLRVLRRRWPLVVGAPVVALVVALAVTIPAIASAQRTLTPYQATHLMLQSSPETANIPLGTIALVASSGRIPQQVVDEIGAGEAARALVADTTVTADAELQVISITATTDDPDAAERVVDTYAGQILAFLRDNAATNGSVGTTLDQQQQRLDTLDEQLATQPAAPQSDLIRAERDQVLRRIGRLTERREQLRQQGGTLDVGLRTLQAGVAVPVDPEGFQPPTTPGPRLLLATLMGLLLGIALAFVVDRADTTIRSRADAESAYAVPVIAEIPRLGRRANRKRALVTTARPGSMAAESYRQLRLGVQVMPRWLLRRSVEPGSLGELVSSRLDLEVDSGRGRVVLVTSPGPGEGKTTTAANLAASFAEIGNSVLLLDCDFRAPQLSAMLKAEAGIGVADYLRHGGGARALAEMARPSFVPNVWVVPAGKAVGNPGELIRPDTDLVTVASTLADIVIVDAGPLLAVNEGATLAPLVDATVLVARAGLTTTESARRASDLVARIEAPVSGSVLVGVSTSELGSRYYYGNYGTKAQTNGHKPQAFPQQPQVLRG
jgi:capsular exopolysaccharide synthesis family protein